MAEDVLPVQVARMDERLSVAVADIAELKIKVQAIHDLIAKGKGAWGAIALLFTILAGIFTTAGVFMHKWFS